MVTLYTVKPVVNISMVRNPIDVRRVGHLYRIYCGYIILRLVFISLFLTVPTNTINIILTLNCSYLKDSYINIYIFINDMDPGEIKSIIYGTTIFVDSIQVELEYGTFMSYTFQDLINKSYIIALVSGNIQSANQADSGLYCRIHSSCITSETFGSLDCDCYSQLKGALKTISKQNGVLFYLLQEGRGCGYVGKSRACMIVQHSRDQLTTFQAYHQLGMVKDYRCYRNIRDIFKMMTISPSLILLTNNPDKITGLTNLGIKILERRAIEITPNQFNHHYLRSKKESGHRLGLSDQVSNSEPPEISDRVVTPFNPYKLDQIRRFIHTSSYYLPIGPLDNKVFLKINDTTRHLELENIPKHKIHDQPVVSVEYDHLLKGRIEPFWFKVKVLYDLVNQNEFVILEYRTTSNISETVVPVVRIHSESIFNRFPLKQGRYRETYQRALTQIIHRGYGYLIMFYHDGRGFGLGNFVLNKTAKTEQESNHKDRRDYYAVALIIKHLLGSQQIDITYSCTKSLSLIQAKLRDHNIKVGKYIYIGLGRETLGHQSLTQWSDMNYQNLTIARPPGTTLDTCIRETFPRNGWVTGIGSSKSHAYYLISVLNYYLNCSLRFVPMSELRNTKFIIPSTQQIIIFSQGISPHIKSLLSKLQLTNVTLITSSKQDHGVKCQIQLTDSLENDTLLRLHGPYQGYMITWKILNQLSITLDQPSRSLPKYPWEQQSLQETSFFGSVISKNMLPNTDFLQTVLRHQRICLLVDYPMNNYLDNIRMKFVEGCGFDIVQLVDPYELVHGTYQCLEGQRLSGNKYAIIWFNNETDPMLTPKIELLLEKYKLWTITSKLPYFQKILDYELVINEFVLQIMDYLDVDQVNWPGKDTQGILYNT